MKEPKKGACRSSLSGDRGNAAAQCWRDLGFLADKLFRKLVPCKMSGTPSFDKGVPVHHQRINDLPLTL